MANPATKEANGPKVLRILLIEDNAGDVYLLEKTLQNRELCFKLIHYADGKQAIVAPKRIVSSPI
jgi:CheY-like chemotaxis protein